MFRLHPVPDTEHTCPSCHVELRATGWYVPGMRSLADLECPDCGTEYYGDLPAGHALYYPILLEKATGEVHGAPETHWFAKWLAESYADRTDDPVGLEVEQHSSVETPVVLNCLDAMYGHSLLKLLNVQHYLDDRPETDPIVLVQSFLSWLVPEDVAEVWSIDLPLDEGTQWNEWLARELAERVGDMDDCFMSPTFPHPHPDDYDIARFSGVDPFPHREWEARLNPPAVTYVWRGDRFWSSLARPSVVGDRFGDRVGVQLGENRLVRWAMDATDAVQRRLQSRKIVSLAEGLRDEVPGLDFAIAGIGDRGTFPGWITDLRVSRPTVEEERALCRRYAESHVVIGVHGSNMLLPVGHAGGLIELMPENRWSNMVQDMLARDVDQRETFFDYHMVPVSTDTDVIVDIATTMLYGHRSMMTPSYDEWDGNWPGPDSRADSPSPPSED